jgi:hypothetical protein
MESKGSTLTKKWKETLWYRHAALPATRPNRLVVVAAELSAGARHEMFRTRSALRYVLGDARRNAPNPSASGLG